MPAIPISRRKNRDLKARCATTNKVVLYARVSSSEQESEGYSIPSQIRLLRDYAEKNGFEIVEEFVEVSSARRSGRPAFQQMLMYLRKHGRTRQTILVEKLDRLSRNLLDMGTLNEMNVTIHLVKNNQVFSPESKSSDKFVINILSAAAQQYSDNLSEETQKGLKEKALSGVYPSCAPAGYRNIDGPNGKRILAVDPETADTITDLFQRFATGKYSLESLTKEFTRHQIRLNGKKIHKSTLHYILRRRLYMGDFDWDGETYPGTHEPLVSRECWNAVQRLLDLRAEKKIRKVKHDFTYTGILRCGHCGCSYVGELKKQKYVYYHCTGNRGKCSEPYTKEEILNRQFADLARSLALPKPVLEWLNAVVRESDETGQRAQEKALRRMKAQLEQIDQRMGSMYKDKLDGLMEPEFFTRQAERFEAEKKQIRRRIQELEKQQAASVDETFDLLKAMNNISRSFEQQPVKNKQKFLHLILKDAVWKGGELKISLFEPFEILSHSNSASIRNEKENVGVRADFENWLLG